MQIIIAIHALKNVITVIALQDVVTSSAADGVVEGISVTINIATALQRQMFNKFNTVISVHVLTDYAVDTIRATCVCSVTA